MRSGCYPVTVVIDECSQFHPTNHVGESLAVREKLG
jgi:hypothetical protein